MCYTVPTMYVSFSEYFFWNAVFTNRSHCLLWSITTSKKFVGREAVVWELIDTTLLLVKMIIVCWTTPPLLIGESTSFFFSWQAKQSQTVFLCFDSTKLQATWVRLCLARETWKTQLSFKSIPLLNEAAPPNWVLGRLSSSWKTKAFFHALRIRGWEEWHVAQ